MSAPTFTDALDRLLGRIETFLRYIAPGFVLVATLGAVGPEPARSYILDVDSHGVVVAALGVLVGVLLYTAHLPLLFALVAPRLTAKWDRTALPPPLTDQSQDQISLFLASERWLRRSSAHERVRLFQREITRWSSNNHFLYCSGSALVMVAAASPLFDKRIALGRVAVLIIGVLLYVLSFASDRRNAQMELWAIRTFPGGKDLG